MHYNGSHHSEQFEFCRTSYPPWTNVINKYDITIRDVLREDGEPVMPDEEIHCDLYRELLHRFSEGGDIVFDLFAGSFSSALAALAGKRRYIGFETNETRYDLGVERLFQRVEMLLNQGQLFAFPEWTSDLTKGDIPLECYPPNIHVLKQCKSELEGAIIDARGFNLEIRKSNITGADFGLFTTTEMKAGTIIGYYWGRIVVADDSEIEVYKRSDRILSLHKFQLGPNGRKRHLRIIGSKLCAASYANDPRTIRPVHWPNAYFDERGTISLGYQLVPFILFEDVDAGKEVYVDYGSGFSVVDLGCEVTPQIVDASADQQVAGDSATVPPAVTIGNVETTVEKLVEEDTCGGCGESLKDGSHKCDICGRPNHPWCGMKMGEGHGEPVRCRNHGDEKH